MKRWTEIDHVLVRKLCEAVDSNESHTWFADSKTAKSFQHRMKLACKAIRMDAEAPRELQDAAASIAWSVPVQDARGWLVRGYRRKVVGVPMSEIAAQIDANR